MNNLSSKHAELRTLMDQALDVCMILQNYTEENFDAFLSDDDARITEIISTREKMIETLIGIEYKADTIFEEEDEYCYGEALPNDIDEIRQSVRTVLGDISAKDMEIMTIISSKMQLYKIETLKARNKKSLSAYIKTTFSIEPGDSIDFSK